jgi:HSP20 family protein
MKKDRKRTPWDDLFFDLDEEFEEMHKRMDRLINQMLEGDLPFTTEPMIYGFSMRVGPDGRPLIQEFGNASSRHSKQESTREPLTDIIEEEDKLRIIIELPGVEKSDIHLHATDDTLDIDVDNPHRKFSKHLELPCGVDQNSARASYKNGVLEITLSRLERQRTGQKIEID